MTAHPFVIFWLVKFLVRTGTIALVGVGLYWLASKMSPGAKAFWLGVFSDGGDPSFSRVASILILIACLAWDSLYVYATMHDKAHGIQLPDWEQLSGQALLIGVPYGLNVGGKAVAMLRSPVTAADCPPAPTAPKGN